MFYDQLEILCRKNGTTPTAVTVLLGYSKGTMSNWKKGTTPNGDAVVRFSEHFNVSTDYFLLGKNNEKKSDLNSEENELIKTYRNLDSRGRHMVQAAAYSELDRIEKTTEKFPKNKQDIVS